MLKFIKIDRDVLMRPDLSDKAKMVLGLIVGLRENGCRLSNTKLAETFGCHPKHISRILTELHDKNLIQIVNPQSRYRRIYCNKNAEVECLKGKRQCGSKVSASVEVDVRNYKEVLTSTTNVGTSMTFLLKNSETWTLPAAKLTQYRDTFAGLDVDGELAKAAQWLCDNPTRRKTDRGMPRYLGGWLGRVKPAVSGSHVMAVDEVDRLLDDPNCR